MPFLNLREDGNLAALFVDDHGSHVWGIDQEFVMSPALHLDTLKDASTDDASRTLVESWRKRADAAYATMVKNHDPEQMPLLEFSAAEFAELSGLFDAGTASRTLIDALAASAQIYRDQSTDPYASNLARSQLMKRNFMDYYRAASGQPRAMFKLGAYHAGRGRSPTGVYDIGNLVSELAAANGSHSTHILVLAGSGTVNRAMPFLPGDSARSVEYDAAEELAVLAAEPLLVAAKGAAVSMFDCAALRRGGLPKATPVALRELIFQYD